MRVNNEQTCQIMRSMLKIPIFLTCLLSTSAVLKCKLLTMAAELIIEGRAVVAITGDKSAHASVVVPSGVEEIKDSALIFSGLESLTLPPTLKTIGPGAFQWCEHLTSLTLPDALIELPEYLCKGCSGLTALTLPNNLLRINANAFYSCIGLTSLKLPPKLISIGRYAFCGCSGLTSLTLPDSLTLIDGGAFLACSSLQAVSLPHALETVNKYAFKGCTALSMPAIAFRPRASRAFIAWSIGSSCHRYNWGLTTLKRLRNVLHLITALAFEEPRLVSSLTPYVFSFYE